MADLVERYIHQVGRYLPGKERADIEAELRSQIHDQLEDRCGKTPTEADVAAVLSELGDPRRMAVSYGGEQYLVGPELYPVMMMVLRRGWVIVPPIAILVRVLATMLGDDAGNFITLLLESIGGAFQATFLFTAIVVLIFAILERSGEDLDEITGNDTGFDPRDLPEVNHPAEVDRVEATFGIAFGSFFVLVLLYFLRVGGLTLRFNLGDPGEVIPVPIPWLMALIVLVTGQVIMELVALLRGRWTVATWLFEAVLEIAGAFALYYVLWLPLSEVLFAAVAALANVPLIERGPEIILGVSIILTVAGKMTKLVKMLTHHADTPASYNVKAG